MRCYPIWDIGHEGPYTSVVAALLQARGMDLAELTVDAGALHDPALLVDMDKAVGRTARAIRDGEPIVVFGDYDVDGITSTALLLDFLRAAGAAAVALLPSRHTDGYGLRPAGIQRAAELGARLIITVDNGISAYAALEQAAGRGIDVVVTDHHQQLDRLPPAAAIVNPNRQDSTYPFRGLAGVGVAFKLVQALSEQFMSGPARRTYLNSLLDLVALGTVADIMPVLGENRLFIQRGLQVLNQSARPGLRRLLAVAGYQDKLVDSTGVAFHLGPRLNVAGRLDKPDLALDLLLSQDDAAAAPLAEALNQLNAQRQALQRDGLAEAEQLLDPQELVTEPLILLLGERWHLGVIGLVATRLAEKHARPAVVCTAQRQDGTYTGSARSTPCYDISSGVAACADLLLTYGGHPGAAGFCLAEENYEAFRVRLLEHARGCLTAADLQPRLAVELVLQPGDISLDTTAALQALEPFGPGNPVPVFAARGCHVVGARAIGRQGDHLRLDLRHGGTRLKAVWWNQGELAAQLSSGGRVDAAFQLQVDTYGGRNAVQLVLQDMYLS